MENSFITCGVVAISDGMQSNICRGILGVTLEFPDFPVGSISVGNESQILEYRVV